MADFRAQKFQQGFLMGQSIADALERKQMRDELKAANALTPEQQTLGVNAPAAGAVPTGYEDYIQAGEGGKFVPRQTEGLDEAGLQQRQVIADRFNQPNAFAGEKTMYTLGGLTREQAFSPAEVAQARLERKADIYSNYGKEDVAENLRTAGLQRRLLTSQAEKADREARIAAEREQLSQEYVNNKRALELGSKSIISAIETGQMTAEDGAKLLRDFYNHNVPNDMTLTIADNKILHPDPKDPNKYVAQDITPKNIVDAFKGMPDLFDKAYENRYNALGGDLKAIGETRRAEQQLGFQERGLNLQQRGQDLQNDQFYQKLGSDVGMEMLRQKHAEVLQNNQFGHAEKIEKLRFSNDKAIAALKADLEKSVNKDSAQYKLAEANLVEMTKKRDLLDKYNNAYAKKDFNGVQLYGRQLEALDPKTYAASKYDPNTQEFVTIGLLSSQANPKSILKDAMNNVKDIEKPEQADTNQNRSLQPRPAQQQPQTQTQSQSTEGLTPPMAIDYQMIKPLPNGTFANAVGAPFATQEEAARSNMLRRLERTAGY
jgi:hypothetical protein